jgi:hypothetical protein
MTVIEPNVRLSLCVRIKPTCMGKWMCSSAHSEPQNWNQQDWVWISCATYGFCTSHQRAARCGLLLCWFQYVPVECSDIHLLVSDWKFAQWYTPVGSWLKVLSTLHEVCILKIVFFISPVLYSFMIQLNSQGNQTRWWSGLNVFYDFINGLVCMACGSCQAERECGIRKYMGALS